MIPDARPTNDISIIFEIQPKCAMVWFIMYFTDHIKILHTSRQCNSPAGALQFFIEFHWNSIEMLLVGRAPALAS